MISDNFDLLDSNTDLASNSYHVTLPFVCKTILAKSDLRSMCLNIRSLRKNFDELQILLNLLSGKVDVIILTETWTDKDSFIPCLIGYNSFASNTKINQNSGVVIYVKEELKAHSVSVKPQISSSFNVVQIQFVLQGLKFSILGVYRSPSQNDFGQFVSYLQELLVSCLDSKCIVAGDFNVDIMADVESSNCTDYMNLLCAQNFRTCVTHATRVGLTSQTCIDHFNINFQCNYEAFSFQSTATDHYPIFLAIKLNNDNVKVQNNPVCKVLSKYVHFDSLKADLDSSTCWNHVFTSDDPDEAYRRFYNILNSKIEKHSSSRFIKKTLSEKPWITDNVLKLIERRNKLHTSLSKDPFNLCLREQYSPLA